MYISKHISSHKETTAERVYDLSKFVVIVMCFVVCFKSYSLASTAGSSLLLDRSDLFNGNISHMVTTLTNPNTNTTIAQGTAYKYDQLNRLKQMRAHRNLDYATNVWSSTNGNDGSYAEDYSYNANGSIQSLKRNGLFSIASGAMDNFTYKYETIANGYLKNTNKLRSIQDAVPSTTYTDDMDNQQVENYAYDAIGNLIKDDFECIQNIEWTLAGKVSKVTRKTSCTTEGTAMPDLEFKYDAQGNMIEKIVKPAVTLANTATWTHTYYVYDASGNRMASYEETNGVLTLDAHELYGSAHLGTAKANSNSLYTRVLGKKSYFLSDHRGNNNVTISDLKTPVVAGSSIYYDPIIQRAVDYYPFGREMNGRIFHKDESEFGYNGKPNVKEWSARLGGMQNYGMRIYFPDRIIFGSEDPLTSDYPWYTPYQYGGNKPIANIDLDGLEDLYAADGKTIGNGPFTGTTKLNKVNDYHLEQGNLYGKLHPMGNLNVSKNTNVVATRPPLRSVVVDKMKGNYIKPGVMHELSGAPYGYKLNSVSFNLRLSGSVLGLNASFGPSFENSKNSVAGSFNAESGVSSNVSDNSRIRLSFDIGFKFTPEGDNERIYSSFKFATKVSTTNQIGILGNGAYLKNDLTFSKDFPQHLPDYTTKMGVQIGLSPNDNGVSNSVNSSAVIKGTEATQKDTPCPSHNLS